MMNHNVERVLAPGGRAGLEAEQSMLPRTLTI